MTIYSSKKIVIVIPVYKSEPNDFEKLSFIRSLKVLKTYSICIISPENINLSKYYVIAKKENTSIENIFFPEECFKDIYTYSKLLTSSFFYNCFVKFEYMLIYQLDAYIFKDDLIEWAEKEYDFIGAPISNKTNELISRKFKSDFNAELILENCLLNGGFSLRNIRSCLKIINYNKEHIETLINKQWVEDVIFSLLFRRTNSNLPNELEAIKFSFESFPKDSFKVNNNKLPTGCHAWYRNDFEIHDNEFWFERIIPTYFWKLQILKKIYLTKYAMKYYIKKLLFK